MLPAIENVAGDDEQEILLAPGERPVKRKDEREKNQVGNRVENHWCRSGPSFRT